MMVQSGRRSLHAIQRNGEISHIIVSCPNNLMGEQIANAGQAGHETKMITAHMCLSPEMLQMAWVHTLLPVPPQSKLNFNTSAT